MGAHCGSKSNKDRSKNNCERSTGHKHKKGNEKVNTNNTDGYSSNEPRLAKLKTNSQTQNQQPFEQIQLKESSLKDSSGGAANICSQVLAETDHISSVRVPNDKAKKKMVDSHSIRKEKFDVGASNLKDKHPQKQISPTVKDTVDECEKNIADSHHVCPNSKPEAGVNELKNEHSQGKNGGPKRNISDLQRITKIDQMRVINRKFDKIDKNSDGRLSREEFVSCLKETNTSDLDPKEFSKIAHGKKFITRQDLTEFYICKTWDAIISDFMMMDAKGDLKISKEVFVDSCRSNQNLCSEYQAEMLFEKLDVNGDDELSFKEFKGGMEQEYIVRTLERFLDFGDIKEVRNHEKGAHPLLFPQCCPPERITKFHIVYEDGLAKLKNATVIEAFNQIDWEMKDRVITNRELTKYFSQQGVSKSDCEKLFNNFDEYGNGVVNYEAFKKYFLRTARQL